MCGIAGIVHTGTRAQPPSVQELRRMLATLRHRGPDEFGLYRDPHAGLVHARLSIVDLQTGQQPMTNEDGSIWVVFNGEIFNYIELRQQLQALGHTFRTQSDTEVIVHAFEAWGHGCFARFQGQFAIALWRALDKTLVLARDWAGIHPLHLYHDGSRVLFASEVKALFAADPSLRREFDPVGLDQTFTFWSIVPPQSVFANVSEVRPGHVRVYSRGDVQERPFWQPSYPRRGQRAYEKSVEAAAEQLGETLQQATSLRMLRADVPVGCYLSGGLDSSIVAAMGLRAQPKGFQTFSLRFADAEYDETSFQRQMAQAIGSEHHEVMVSRRDIAEVLPSIIWHTERPILRTAPAPLFLLSRLVRQSGTKVVLTGEGADEVFAGYDLFREAKIRRFWARHPDSPSRPLLLSRLYPYLARSPVRQQQMARQFFGRNLERAAQPGFSHEPRWHSTSAVQRLMTAELRQGAASRAVVEQLLASLPPEYSSWSPLAQDQYLEIQTLLSGYLLSSQGDRMLMAHSVEGRFPFLDQQVVAFANSLPDDYKLRVLDEKHVLKRAAAHLLPPDILQRKKQPYRAPDALSFVESPAPSWIAEVLRDDAIRQAGVFDPQAVRLLWSKCQARAPQGQFSNTDNMAIVGVLTTQLLHELLVRHAPQPDTDLPFRVFVDRVSNPPTDQ